MNGLADAVLAMFASEQKASHKVMIATVVSFNADKGTVDAKPAVSVTDENGNNQDYPVLFDLGVLYPSAGGLHIHWPITKGDQGIVIFNDVCIDEWRGKRGNVTTENGRRNALSDGLFVPMMSSSKSITEHLELSRGQMKVSLEDSRINIGSSGFDGVVRKSDLQSAIDSLKAYVDLAVVSHVHTGGTIMGNTGNGVQTPVPPPNPATSSNEVFSS